MYARYTWYGAKMVESLMKKLRNDYDDLGHIFQMMNRVPTEPTLFM